MALFGKKKAAQTYVAEDVQPTPQSDAPVQAPIPTFDDPDDATRWELVQSANAAFASMMETYSACCDIADTTEKAYAMGDTEYVDGVRQHEISRKNFHDMGVRSQAELERRLAELQVTTAAARELWQNLVFLLPGPDNDVMKIANWCMTHEVDSEVMTSLMGNSILMNTDFGTTRESFWAENDRVEAVLNNARQ